MSRATTDGTGRTATWMPLVITAAAVLVLASSSLVVTVRHLSTPSPTSGVDLLERRQRVLVGRIARDSTQFSRTSVVAIRRLLQAQVLEDARLLDRSQPAIEFGGTAPAGGGLQAPIDVPVPGKLTSDQRRRRDAYVALGEWFTRSAVLGRAVVATAGPPTSSAQIAVERSRLDELGAIAAMLEQRSDQPDGIRATAPDSRRALWIAVIGAFVGVAALSVVWLLGVRPALRSRRPDAGADRRSAPVDDAEDGELDLITAFSGAFAALGHAVLLADADERIITVNQRFCEVLGIDRDPEALGGSSVRLVLRGASRWTGDLERSIGTGRSTGAGPAVLDDGTVNLADETVNLADGTVTLADGRALLRTFVPVQVHGERLSMWVLSEITDDRREAMALEQAKTSAEEALARKGTMLAVACHEVRGSMHGILALIDELQHTPLEADQQQILASLLHAGASLRGVVDQTLNLSRLESGALEVRSERMDLRTVVRESTAVIAGMLAAKSVRSDIRIQRDLPLWRAGDPVRLGEILTNLLINAAKSTEAGSVSLSVQQGEGDHVRFAAGDTGPGISGAAVRRLVSATPASGLRGSDGAMGLGLLITRELVELLGGTMSVASVPGQGTLFTVDLPLPPLPPPSSSSVIDLTAQDSIGQPRVLVVDDSPDALAVLCLMLRRLGATVDSTDDPHEAVRRCREHRYDLVVLDSIMPALDGPSTAQLIRLEEQASADPISGSPHRAAIIAATADVSHDVSSRCLAAGMDAYLAKPFTLAELRQVVRDVLVSQAMDRLPPKPGAQPGVGSGVGSEVGSTAASSVAPSTTASIAGDTGWVERPTSAPDQTQVLARSAVVLAESDMTRDLADHPEIVADGYDTFLVLLDERVERISSASRNGNQLQLRDAAHHLGSPALVLGAEALGWRCRALESAVRDGQGDEVTAALVAEIEGQAEAVRTAMSDRAERLRGSLNR